MVRFCDRCFNLTEEELCDICRDAGRDTTTICVVEEPGDIISIERTHEYRGLYHVLGGALSPLDGIGPAEAAPGRTVRPRPRRRACARSSWPPTPTWPVKPRPSTSPRSCGAVTAAGTLRITRPAAGPAHGRRPRVRRRGHAGPGPHRAARALAGAESPHRRSLWVPNEFLQTGVASGAQRAAHHRGDDPHVLQRGPPQRREGGSAAEARSPALRPKAPPGTHIPRRSAAISDSYSSTCNPKSGALIDVAEKSSPPKRRTPATEDAVGSQYVVIGGPERKAERTNIIVMKFGGSSVADATCMKRVAKRIVDARKEGHPVVAVVSARGDTTDELIETGQGDLRQPAGPRDGHAPLHRRAHLGRPAGHGHPRAGLSTPSPSPARRPASSPTPSTPRPRSSTSSPIASSRPSTRTRSSWWPASRGSPPSRTSPRWAVAAPTPPPSPWRPLWGPRPARSTPTWTASTPPTRASCPRPASSTSSPTTRCWSWPPAAPRS